MNNKHKATLKNIFHNPILATVLWKDIETMLIALGAEVSEGHGSRVRVAFKGLRAVFHRPHPHKETDKGAIASIRRFLMQAGVKPC